MSLKEQWLQNFFLILQDKNWLKKYIFWELELLKILGYDLELENLVEKDTENNETVYYVSSSNEKKYVPNFLIEKDKEVEDIKILLKGLKLVNDYLDKTILKPNNINFPNNRLLFLNTLRWLLYYFVNSISVITHNSICTSSFKRHKTFNCCFFT